MEVKRAALLVLFFVSGLSALEPAEMTGCSEADIANVSTATTTQNLGTPTAYTEAAETYRNISYNGCVAGMSRLAFLLREGLGVMQSATEAQSWYQRAAQLGDLASWYEVVAIAESVSATELTTSQVMDLYDPPGKAGEMRASFRVWYQAVLIGASTFTGTGMLAPPDRWVSSDCFVVQNGHVVQTFVPELS